MALLHLTANCGCIIEADVYPSRICYCGPDDYCYCFDSEEDYTADNIVIRQPCSGHGGN